VASPSPVRMRTSGTQMTLRRSRSETLFCGFVWPAASGSKFMESNSRRCCSAWWITSRERADRSHAACGRGLCRATRVSRASPWRRSRKPRSAPVMVRAVSTTETRTSSTEKELCNRAGEVEDGAQLGQVVPEALRITRPIAGRRRVPEAASIPRPSGVKISW